MTFTNSITTNNASPGARHTAISPEQMRAARGLLGWSRNKLAHKAGTSAETIKNIEHGVYSPKKETLAAIVETFLRNGIQFVHYETLVTVPTGNDAVGELQARSYAGAVRVTSFVPQIEEEGDE
ncbi:MAG: helix-turn-helix transcriptional regulator [Alphaproteobacteria bacterium]|jgi:DNA-binding XRE family transcriptional regulator|nr:helix-turn-helix transcriptional regulator [Alphaproteobacteria bacterium]